MRQKALNKKYLLLIAAVIIYILHLSPFAFAGEIHYRVRFVTFKGIKKVDKKELLESLATKERPVWRFWTAKPEVTLRDLDDDVLRIKQFYRANGYFQTKAWYEKKVVNPSECAAKDGARPGNGPESAKVSEKKTRCVIDVTFHVEPGPAVRIHQVNWSFAKKAPGLKPDVFMEQIPLKIGKIFRTDDYDTAKLLIIKILGNRGYPFATVGGQVQVDLKTEAVSIHFTVNPGKIYRFGDIRIEGDKGFVHEIVIRRALTFQPGERYSVDKLDESRQNLFALNIFKAAVIQPGTPSPGSDTVPIQVRIKPQKPQNVELGIGYGTEDHLRLQGTWRYRNLTRNADQISISARHSSLLDNIQGEYLYPYFFNRKNTLRVDAGFEKEYAEYFNLKNIFSTVSLQRRLTEHWVLTPWYSMMINEPSNISPSLPQTPAYLNKSANYVISSVKFDLERDDVDNEINPTRGSVLSFSFESASRMIGSEISYYKPAVEAKCYIPLPHDLVFASRVRFRSIQEMENTKYIPLFLQLFLGGSKTVRGYGYQQLGVYNHDNMMVGIGGRSSFCGNLELRFPIYGDFSGVTFLDMGVLDEQSFQIDFSTMRYSCGVGLRYNTIIGPIQLDFGYKLNPPKGSAIAAESADTSHWQFDFNIGQAF